MIPTTDPPRRTRSLFPALTLATAVACLVPAASLPAQEPGGPFPPRQGPGGERPFLYAQMFRALDEKASLLLEQGKTEAAVEEMRRAFAIEVPKESPVYELKSRMIGRFALTLAGAGRKKEAVETIQRLLSEVPAGSVAEAGAWLDAGGVYKQAGMPDEALKAFDRSIELSQKLARTRGPAGPPMPPTHGRPMRPPQNPPRGEPQ